MRFSQEDKRKVNQSIIRVPDLINRSWKWRVDRGYYEAKKKNGTNFMPASEISSIIRQDHEKPNLHGVKRATKAFRSCKGCWILLHVVSLTVWLLCSQRCFFFVLSTTTKLLISCCVLSCSFAQQVKVTFKKIIPVISNELFSGLNEFWTQANCAFSTHNGRLLPPEKKDCNKIRRHKKKNCERLTVAKAK